jgi:hypothetical protein
MKPVTLQSTVRLCPDLQLMDIDEATVIAPQNGGNCYGVESIAKRIWQLIGQTETVAELCEVLLKEYLIDAETCELEVLEFFNESGRQGLIQVTG